MIHSRVRPAGSRAFLCVNPLAGMGGCALPGDMTEREQTDDLGAGPLPDPDLVTDEQMEADDE